MKLRLEMGKQLSLLCPHFSLCWRSPLLRAFIHFLGNTSKPPFQHLLLCLIQLLLLQTLSRKIIVKTPAALYDAGNSCLPEAIKQPFEFSTTVYFRKVIEIFPTYSFLSGSLFKHDLTYKEF